MLLGLSHHCFIVTAVNLDSQKSAKYFVKSLSLHASTEQNERLVAQSAAISNLSPQVIYHCKEWLVTEYIEGYSLFENQYTIAEKIAVAMKLLQDFHQLAPIEQVSSLSLQSLIEAQINANVFSDQQKSFLFQLNQDINDFTQVTEPVVCHGDLNFTNILIDKQSKAWLVDYECTSIGSAEYDVAMFIAINNLSNCDFSYIFDCYQGQSKKPLNHALVHAYLACCYLINGLWYQEHSHNIIDNDQYIDLAYQQYSQFDRLKLSDIKLVEQLL
ncbi:phosphotransferase [Colwellia sp. 1_MG-2023]|uniref:phosphotransferase n=1 Tax=Colwellia sp. 1_MG-2023 TaxID=3062649 RepID=UPI0026E284BA|nr:phosphotransferase [Colwellia sp. 1_MG-2023]MDO6445466.1 phosphotransferase [Colwellia sp. 1_MG-2023]